MTTLMDDALLAALSGEMTPKFLATLDAEGRPNIVPVISIAPWKGDELIFGEFFMNKSRKNLLVNPHVAVAVLDGALRGWSLRGEFQGFEILGEKVEHINRSPMFRYNAYTSIRAAGAIRVTESACTGRLSRLGLLGGFARLAVAGMFTGGAAEGRSVMPRPVRGKFRRLSAARALAFCDRDGLPRAVPLMGCVPRGKGRLLIDGRLLERSAPSLEPGTPVAVAIITMAPVAYQVKGVYEGRRAGAGIVGLSACYSASPPLLGERLDAPEPVPGIR